MTITPWSRTGHDSARPAELIPQQRGAGAGTRPRHEHPHFSDVGMAHRRRHTRGTVSVVVPTLNEAANVGWALSRLPAGIDEVVLVDGRSTDGTVEAALRVRPDIKVVLETRPGKGAALRAGFAAANGDYVVMIDADGSMHPEEIALYVAYLEAGYDFVKGSRFMLSGGSADMTQVRRTGHWPRWPSSSGGSGSGSPTCVTGSAGSGGPACRLCGSPPTASRSSPSSSCARCVPGSGSRRCRPGSSRG